MRRESLKKNDKNAQWQLKLTHRALANLYHGEHCDCDTCQSDIERFNAALDLSDWLKVMAKIAQDRYEGKLKAGELDNAYILNTYEELKGGFTEGFDSPNFKVHGATNGISPETLKMRQNLFKFSGAKTYTLLEEINQILNSNKGETFDSFKNEVLKLNPRYNKNYLQAEWQTAKQAGYHAANWDEYQNNKDLYLNLKYKTQGDNRVREPHRLLNGIIAPLDSDFWKTHYPPNGWRCRCYVVQTAEKPTDEKDIPTLNEKEMPKEFRGNVGISGEIFKETAENKGKPHPYFALFKNAGSKTKKAFEYSKLAAAKELAYTAENGAQVKVSPFADPADFEDNFKTASIIADKLGVSVNIRAHLDSNILEGHKNPELEIKGMIGDRKAIKTSQVKNLRNTYRSAKEQGCECIVFDLDSCPLTIEEVRNEAVKKFKTFPMIKEIFIHKNGEVINIKSNP
ncbi:phage minor head protein [Ornithobacterium rhinotracheale]|uniref:CdiA C-terminal domain-containing protein n=1 Tax=Ornithobacterium rhinotracheale TaxID=28251 RepID=UPI001FF47694|nr:phage minor head protein [Ornithobacterium rhinotracheale]MCK0201138.1 minor capsid protein [Ornithobacterium rhinotracheale]